MNHIIKELIDNGYNITKTDDPNIYEYTSQGVTLEMNTKIEPDTWSYSDPNVPIHAKNDFDDVISIYKRIREEKMKALDDVDFSMAEEPNGYKNGGYKTKVKETKKFDMPDDEIQDASYVPIGKQREVKHRPSRMIKGLTPRLAECGKIKIGKKGKLTTSKKGTEFRPPEKVDYFFVTTMEKTGEDDYKIDPVIMEVLKERAGSDNDYKCRAIPVRLPYDDPSLNFYTSYSLYESSLCKCKGDGEYAIRDGECIGCNPETCDFYINNKCKPHGVLSVILDDAPRVGGVYKFRTVGWNSINNIISSMEFIRGLTNGILAGLPLILTLTPKHTTIPGTKTPTTIYMVNVEYRGSLSDMAKAIKQTMDTRALMQYSVKDFEKLAEEALALPESPEECREIVEEFCPEVFKGV